MQPVPYYYIHLWGKLQTHGCWYFQTAKLKLQLRQTWQQMFQKLELVLNCCLCKCWRWEARQLTSVEVNHHYCAASECWGRFLACSKVHAVTKERKKKKKQQSFGLHRSTVWKVLALATTTVSDRADQLWLISVAAPISTFGLAWAGDMVRGSFVNKPKLSQHQRQWFICFCQVLASLTPGTPSANWGRQASLSLRSQVPRNRDSDPHPHQTNTYFDTSKDL